MTPAQLHKQLNYVIIARTIWDQQTHAGYQTLRVQPSKQFTASLPFPLQLAEVRLNFATCFALTLAEHAFVPASDAASSKANESCPFLQEQETKQSMSEAQLCS